ncbi:MAG: hypothetical protein M1318_03145 [Firmicutes bacterium]|jgi:hypothetical protein|nr:hypothetical protein [Bacillota bacterium]
MDDMQTRITRSLARKLLEYHGDADRAKHELTQQLTSIIDAIQQQKKGKRRRPYYGPDNFLAPEKQAQRLVDSAWEQILADPDQWI